MELSLFRPEVWRVGRGQTVRSIAHAFAVPPRVLCACNALTEEVFEGQLLVIPPAGDLYRVRGGESMTLLCGSPEAFERRNFTRCFYPGQEIFL